MRNYSDDANALEDALRLARSTTQKTAFADLSFGGGKTVVIGDFIKDKNPTLLRALGELVHFLEGAFTIAEDVGTTPEDISVTFTPLHPM